MNKKAKKYTDILVKNADEIALMPYIDEEQQQRTEELLNALDYAIHCISDLDEILHPKERPAIKTPQQAIRVLCIAKSGREYYSREYDQALDLAIKCLLKEMHKEVKKVGSDEE